MNNVTGGCFKYTTAKEDRLRTDVASIRNRITNTLTSSERAPPTTAEGAPEAVWRATSEPPR